jgi:hypothetical protein
VSRCLARAWVGRQSCAWPPTCRTSRPSSPGCPTPTSTPFNHHRPGLSKKAASSLATGSGERRTPRTFPVRPGRCAVPARLRHFGRVRLIGEPPRAHPIRQADRHSGCLRRVQPQQLERRTSRRHHQAQRHIPPATPLTRPRLCRKATGLRKPQAGLEHLPVGASRKRMNELLGIGPRPPSRVPPWPGRDGCDDGGTSPVSRVRQWERYFARETGRAVDVRQPTAPTGHFATQTHWRVDESPRAGTSTSGALAAASLAGEESADAIARLLHRRPGCRASPTMRRATWSWSPAAYPRCS